MEISVNVVIDETQRRVNELMGVSTDDFFKHNKSHFMSSKAGGDSIDRKMMSGCISIPFIESLQSRFNKVLGIDKAGRPNAFINDTQLAVNKQMGIDNATFLKYNK